MSVVALLHAVSIPAVPPETLLPLPAHVPSGSSKQPVTSFMPFANVEVAVVEATFKVETESPPAKVEVAVDVAR